MSIVVRYGVDRENNHSGDISEIIDAKEKTFPSLTKEAKLFIYSCTQVLNLDEIFELEKISKYHEKVENNIYE